MTSAKLHTFPKAQRLKSRKQIDLLFREGKSFFAAPVKCYYRMEGKVDVKALSPEDGKLVVDDFLSEPSILGAFRVEKNIEDLKVGFSVSKRNFKKATDRNRIKRLMREAWRLHKPKLMEQLRQSDKRLEVFLVFTDKSLPAFELVEDKIKYCQRRLGKLVEEGS